MLADFESFMSAEEDHLLPKSKEGADESDNIVTSCNVCNRLKSNYVPKNVDVAERGKYISDVRAYIMNRRAEKMKDFMGWVTHGKKEYYT